MRQEKGVIIAAYQQSLNNHRYLILKRKKNWEGWELPKGHLEDNDYRKTVKQELREEAGLKEDQIKEVTDMHQVINWRFEEDGEKVEREYKAFKVEVDESAEVDVSENPHDEHEQGFFLDFEDGKTLLTYDNHREVLENAEKS
ncbi:MAG: NUDIX domain-containing protein [Candidatus Nanohalobium sp.]